MAKREYFDVAVIGTGAGGGVMIQELTAAGFRVAGSKSKSEKLVCRYCGSDDLAPSFIKRRDRRCRKCFSKRYGSAARARKAKVKR